MLRIQPLSTAENGGWRFSFPKWYSSVYPSEHFSAIVLHSQGFSSNRTNAFTTAVIMNICSDGLSCFHPLCCEDHMVWPWSPSFWDTSIPLAHAEDCSWNQRQRLGIPRSLRKSLFRSRSFCFVTLSQAK